MNIKSLAQAISKIAEIIKEQTTEFFIKSIKP